MSKLFDFSGRIADYKMAEFIKKNFGFSMKNIPTPSNDSYLKQLIHRVEDLITRMRWKAIFFLKKEEEKDNEESESEEGEDDVKRRTYGFRSTRVPERVNEMEEFEKDVWDMVEQCKFKDKGSESAFQKKMKNEIKEINKSDKLLIPADKTSNMYQVRTQTYNKLLKDNTTRAYKKVDRKEIENINKEAKKIAHDLKIGDRVEKMPEKDAFITLKDHKQNFMNDTKCRLINPTKSEIGKVSNIILQEINQKIREKTGLQQWRSTKEAIEWFKNIDNKEKMEFIQCDIEDFYPSISEQCLLRCITFAEKYTIVPDIAKKAILNARKTVLVNGEDVWQKKDSLFDVAMGAFDGAEVAELVGLKLLAEIKQKVPELNFGLYRDDGLATIKTGRGCKIENAKKKLIQIFKNEGLKITIETRLHRVNFLDVTLDLQEKAYKPFKKPGDKTMYIHTESNHPPQTKKAIPKMVEKRLASISSNKDIFDEGKKDYEEALRESGYKEKLSYEKGKNNLSEKDKNKDKKKKKNRKRKEIYFNPPWNDNLNTNIGGLFLKIVDKHFGSKRKDNLNKIFNRKKYSK